MIKKIIYGTGLSLLMICSTAMCASVNFKIANATEGTLSISPEICYPYYRTPDQTTSALACDPTQTGVSVSPITTQDQQISIDVPHLPRKAADSSQGNYGWSGKGCVLLMLPGSSSSANVNGVIAAPSSDWGDNYFTCPAKLLSYDRRTVLVLHAYGTWLTYEFEGTVK